MAHTHTHTHTHCVAVRRGETRGKAPQSPNTPNADKVESDDEQPVSDM
jgi:hypothetical protein